MTQVILFRGRRAVPWLAVILIVSLYLASRLLWLDNLPVFIDEALQIRAIQLVRNGSISAGAADGKWLSLLIMSLFTDLPGDPLYQIRLASVLSGLITVIAVIYCGRILFGWREGWLAAMIYILLPFALFYNRLALSDGIAAMFGAWLLYFSVVAAKTDRRWISLMMTILLMMAILAKFSSAIFLLIPILALLTMLPRNRWLAGFRKILPAILAASILVLALYWVDAGLSQAGSKTFTGDLNARRLLLQANLRLLAGWSWGLLTPPGALFLWTAILWALFGRAGRSGWFLVSLLFLSVLPYLVAAGDWYPRYLTFLLVPVSLLMAGFGFWLLAWIKRNTLFRRPVIIIAGLSLAVLVLFTLILDMNIIHKPAQAALPTTVRRLYISDWTAGYGTQELAKAIIDNSGNSSIEPLLMRPGFLSHTYRGGLELYLGQSRPVRLGDTGWDMAHLYQAISGQLEQGGRVFFTLDTTHDESVALFTAANNGWQATRIWSQQKPLVAAGLELWEIHDLLEKPG